MLEADLYRQIQLHASKHGFRLWRNNVGVLVDITGRPVRFGLANESKALNRALKSSDLIGITPQLILPEDVGKIIGVFTSIEVKPPGWRYSGSEREEAQLAWIEVIRDYGGIAGFTDNAEGKIIL